MPYMSTLKAAERAMSQCGADLSSSQLWFKKVNEFPHLFPWGQPDSVIDSQPACPYIFFRTAGMQSGWEWCVDFLTSFCPDFNTKNV